MLERIESVIISREIDTKGTFELFITPIEGIQDDGIPTPSKGASKDKVTSFQISKSIENGYNIGQVITDIPEKI